MEEKNAERTGRSGRTERKGERQRKSDRVSEGTLPAQHTGTHRQTASTSSEANNRVPRATFPSCAWSLCSPFLLLPASCIRRTPIAQVQCKPRCHGHLHIPATHRVQEGHRETKETQGARPSCPPCRCGTQGNPPPGLAPPSFSARLCGSRRNSRSPLASTREQRRLKRR